MNSFLLLSSAAFGLPVVQAKTFESKSDSFRNGETTEKVKPSSLPLYPGSEKLDYTLHPPTLLESYVRDIRIQAEKVKQDYQPILDKIFHIFGTGRAHTEEAITRLQDETNIAGQLGFVTAGGLLGLIAGRKGKLLRKISYISLGLAGSSSICYPTKAKEVAATVGNSALKNARIAYHFAVGTRPTVQNENGKAFERIAQMTSDVWQSGFRLFGNKEVEVEAIKSNAEVDKVQVDSEVPHQREDDKENLSELQPSEVDITSSTLSTSEQADSSAIPSDESLALDDSAEKANEQTNMSAMEPLSEAPIPIESDPSTETKSSLQLEDDMGQSNPEDKELYTTRE